MGMIGRLVRSAATGPDSRDGAVLQAPPAGSAAAVGGRPLALALEPRFMFDAAGLAAGAEAAEVAAAQDAADAAMAEAEQPAADDPQRAGDEAAAGALAAAGTPAADRTELVFVDARLADHESLAEAGAAGAQVVVLDAGGDGVRQMAEALRGRSGLDAIHVVSHGSAGAVHLGTATLSGATLDGYADATSAIGAALTPGGDLLLYGCLVGADGAGEAFLAALADAAGADVAASDDATGAAALGGDWVLERQAGTIETGDWFARQEGAAAYAHLLAPAYASSVSGGANPLSAVPDADQGVIVGDFDTDGDVDVLAYADESYNALTFYRNDGSGGFSAVSGAGNPFDGIAASGQFHSGDNVYVADFDNDGDQDVWDYRGALSNGTSRYLENVGGSSYTSSKSGGANPLSAVPDVDQGVIVGDFDGDGDVDVLAYTDGTYSALTFYRNDGSGGFSAVSGAGNPFDGIAASGQFHSGDTVYVADFDNDGDQDVWDYRGAAFNGTSRYLENVGGSSYTSSKSGGANPLSAVPDADQGVIVGDFDSDGDVDVLAYTDESYSALTFYRNDGSGGFSAVSGAGNPFDGLVASSLFWSSDTVYVADFDSDGDVDVWDYRGQSFDGTSRYLEQLDSPPTLVSSTPTDGAAAVPPGDDLVLQFDETVSLGSGNIEIRRVGDGAAVHTLVLAGGSVTSGGTAVLSTTTNANDTLTLDPDAALPDSTALYVHFDAGVVDDGDQAAALSLIDDPATLNFTTGTGDTPPTLQSFARQTPAGETTNADSLVFRATFDEAVQNVDAGDFVAAGGTTASVTGVNPVGGDVYDVTVSGGDLAGFDGTVGLDLAGGQNIQDLTGNALPGGEPATDETYILDNAVPAAVVVATPIEGDGRVNAAEDADVVVAGTGAEAGATVDISVSDGSNPSVTAQITADGAGNWTLAGGNELDLSGLDQGSLTVSVTQTDAARNVSAAATETILLDSQIAVVTIATPIEGDGRVNAAEDGDVTISGTGAEANATVDISVSDGSNPSVTAQIAADGAGNWTLAGGNELDLSGLDQGNLTVSVTQTDAAGNVSAAATETILLDSQIAAVTIATPIKGDGRVNAAEDGDVTISGTGAEANATVDVSVDDGSNPAVAAQVTADGAGNWTLAGGNELDLSGLDEGSLTVSVTQTDAAGNLSVAATETIAYDRSAPAAPAIAAPVEGDDAINAAEDGDVAISGSGAEANATIDVSISDGSNPAIAAQVTADGAGNWTLAGGNELDVSGLDQGTLTVSATQTDAAGNASAAATRTVAYDSAAPALAGAIAPSVAQIGDAQVGADGFSLTIDFAEAMDTSVDPTVTFPTGGEDPSAVGNTVATLSNPGGAWADADTYVVTYDVADDDIVLNAVDVRVSGARDAAGNVMAATTRADVFSVITAPAPAIQSIASPGGDGVFGVGDSVTVTVTFDEAVDFTANGGTLEILLSNGEAVTLAIADTANQTAFGGTYTIAEGDADSADLDVASVGLTGGAALTANDDGVPAGLAVPAGQNLADTQDIAIDANTPPALQPDLAAASDTGVSDTDNLTADAAPTVSGTTEAGATVAVRVGGAAVGTATADGSGAWSFDFAPGDLAVGANAIDIVASDAVNTSADSPDLVVVLDAAAPALSAVDLVAASDTGASNVDNVTADATPTVEFTAANGSAVEIDWGDGNGFVAAAAGTGAPQQETLAAGYAADGAKTVTVRVSDAAGNRATEALALTLDTAGPTPAIASVSGPTNLDPFPVTVDFGEAVSGFTAGDIVVGGVGGTVTALVDEGGGRFTATVDAAADGTVTLAIAGGTVADVAGNAGLAATPFAIDVDTAAPDAPAVAGPSAPRTVDADELEISGTAEAGSLVRILLDADGDGVLDPEDGTVVGSQQLAAGATAWSIVVPLAQQADNAFLAVAEDAAGNLGAATVVPTVTESPAAEPDSPPPQDAGDVLFLTDGPEGVGRPAATSEPPAADPGAGSGPTGGPGRTAEGSTPIARFVRDTGDGFGGPPGGGGVPASPIGAAAARPTGLGASPVAAVFDGSVPLFSPFAAVGETGSILYLLAEGRWTGFELRPAEDGVGPTPSPDELPRGLLPGAGAGEAPAAADPAGTAATDGPAPTLAAAADGPAPDQAAAADGPRATEAAGPGAPSFTAQLRAAADAFDADAARLAAALAAAAPPAPLDPSS
jgi:hypothetical protein